MKLPTLEVADIIRSAGDRFIGRNQSHLSWQQLKVFRAIQHCRTAALGGHLDQCSRCGHRAISFFSCRNRHCPKCQTNARNKWLAARSDELLGVSYFHVVFTLPHYTHRLAISNHRLVSLADGNVTFLWKDYSHGKKKRKMTITADEFLRRFLLHVLPRGFVRIRHFGFLSARRRRDSIAVCRQVLAEEPRPPSPTPTATPPSVITWPCPCCGGTMVIIEKLTAQQIRLRSGEWKDPIDSS